MRRGTRVGLRPLRSRPASSAAALKRNGRSRPPRSGGSSGIRTRVLALRGRDFPSEGPAERMRSNPARTVTEAASSAMISNRGSDLAECPGRPLRTPERPSHWQRSGNKPARWDRSGQEGAEGDLRGADEREAGTPLARGHPFGHRQARAIRKSAQQGPLPRGCARVAALDGQRLAMEWVSRIVDGDGA